MDETSPNRIWITGGAGSGKTTLSRRLAALLDMPVLDLDRLGMDIQPSFTDSNGLVDYAGFIAARAAELELLTQQDRWIADGLNFSAIDVLCQRADLILAVDTPSHVASYRIVSRHVKATLARNNQFPGWVRLYRFWRWSAGYYAGRNPWGLNDWGTPHTRAYAFQTLQPHQSKLTIYRTKGEVERLVSTLDTSARPKS